MKLTNTILLLALTSGAAWAQNGPVIIQGAKAKADAAQQTQHNSVKVVSAAMPQASKPTPVAKPVPAVASKSPAAKPVSQPVKVDVSQTKPASAGTAQPKRVAVKPVEKPIEVKASPGSKKASARPAKAKVVASKPSPESSKKDESVSVEKAPEPAKNEKSTRTIITANGRRDPFVSPVISQSAVGSGCSSGKRCLSVGQINLKGVVRAETGMIAVVVNALDKAYFLRENDPVFDGYVLKITGDSIVFKETVQDKLGKAFTREVTKKISAPSV